MEAVQRSAWFLARCQRSVPDPARLAPDQQTLWEVCKEAESPRNTSFNHHNNTKLYNYCKNVAWLPFKIE